MSLEFNNEKKKDIFYTITFFFNPNEINSVININLTDQISNNKHFI